MKLLSGTQFKNTISNNYQLSFNGLTKMSIKINYNINKKNQKITQFINNLIKYITDELLNRQNEFISNILRKNKKFCLPHSLFNEQFQSKNNKKIKTLKTNDKLKKFKTKKKFLLHEKLQLNLSESIVYSILRCMNDFNIIILPIAVSSNRKNIDHSNFIILDFRDDKLIEIENKIFFELNHKHDHNSLKKLNKEKKNIQLSLSKNKNKKINIKSYLLEPNGISYSKQRNIYKTIKTIIKNSNDFIKKINKNIIISPLTILGENGIQTELGMKKRNKFNVTIQKQGYPICLAVNYWIITKWGKTNLPSLAVFTKFIFKTILKSDKNRYDQKNDIYQFIKSNRNNLENNYQQNIYHLIDSKIKYFINNKTSKYILNNPIDFSANLNLITKNYINKKLQSNIQINIISKNKKINYKINI